MQVIVVNVDGVRWVIKKPGSPAEAARLQTEAVQLRRAAHPGVVEMAPSDDAGGTDLRTRHAGSSLRQWGPMPAAELCGLGAAVATVLADLHDIGIVHGSVDADHILVGPDGRPLLCGFGASTSAEDGDPALDVRDLTTALGDLLGPDAPRRLVRVLRRTPSTRRGGPTARDLAGALGVAMPDRRLPTGAPPPTAPAPPTSTATSTSAATSTAPVVDVRPGGPEAVPTVVGASVGRRETGSQAFGPVPMPGRRRHPGRLAGTRRLPVLIGGVGAAVAVLVIGVALVGGHGQATRVACPPADRGCGPVPVHDGAFLTASGTFATGLADPVVVLGRWSCGRNSLPAALDPRTGQIWAWLTWADPTRTVTATAVAAPSDAATLRVRPEASGCDRLEVIDAAGATTVLSPEATHGA